VGVHGQALLVAAVASHASVCWLTRWRIGPRVADAIRLRGRA
jgi:hypothetical protein